VDEELCKAQQEMYRDRALQKRTCKTAEDLEFFEASEDDYRERLKQIKLQKKDNRKKLKAVERCLEREGSLTEAELEYALLLAYLHLSCYLRKVFCLSVLLPVCQDMAEISQ
jgi:uncharacterized protein involved in exopolysaccharide biosynthesis